VSFPAVLGGLPPGSVPAIPGDSLRIWPLWRAFHLTCPRVAGPGVADRVDLIRSLSACWRDPSQMCHPVTPPRPVRRRHQPWKETGRMTMLAEVVDAVIGIDTCSPPPSSPPCTSASTPAASRLAPAGASTDLRAPGRCQRPALPATWRPASAAARPRAGGLTGPGMGPGGPGDYLQPLYVARIPWHHAGMAQPSGVHAGSHATPTHGARGDEPWRR
jgi:hypothetical protein